TTISNTATAFSGTGDSNPANNSATQMTAVINQADLSVVKTGPATALAGTDVTYTITVTNNGPNTAPSVTLTDTLPPATTFVAQTGLSGVSVGAGAVSGTLGPVASGGNAVVTIVVHITPATANNTTITDTATATIPAATGVTDPNLGNNTGTAATTVLAQAD